MRVLFVAPNATFIDLFLRRQIELLVQEGHSVLLVCAPPEENGALPAVSGCEYRLLPMARGFNVKSDLQCMAKLCWYIARWKPEMVHSHSPKSGLLGMLAARLCTVAVRVHTFHGLRSETLFGWRLQLVQAMERLTASCSTHALAISHSLRGELVRRRICRGEKLQVLGNGGVAGVDTSVFAPARFAAGRNKARAALGVGAEHVLLTYIGRLANDKGITVLEAAWRLLRTDYPQARLLIAGPEDITDPCETEVLQRLEADPRVALRRGFLRDPALFMAATDVFVQPSFREGLGVAALEAASLEVPVVASRVTGLVDAVHAGQTGVLVEPYSAESLKQGLGQLMERPELRREMGMRGRCFVQAKFEQENVLAAVTSFYHVVHRKRPTAGLPLKRLFDSVASAFLLVALSPLLLILSLAVLVATGRPVFFAQVRAGWHGELITVYKFRTMRSPRRGEAMFATDAVRTTPLGCWMRRLSLDELPQLWNVLRGEMSLVGPRPLLAEYLPRYNSFERRRLDVRPGITGWAQINGRNDLDWHGRFAKDVWYVDHRSFHLDLQILLRTIAKVFRREGVLPQGASAMPEFLGTAATEQS